VTHTFVLSAIRQPATSVDWAAILTELRSPPYRMKWDQIADEAKVKRTTMHGWAICGIEPLFNDGMRLLGLWAKKTGRTIEDAPMR
jgi:hypothetical protein